MICSSVNLVRFIVRPLQGPDSNQSWRKIRGSGHSPDFNPIEKAFSKLKAMLRKIGERTVSGLWDLIGRLVDIFQPRECANYFGSCGMTRTDRKML
jgi:hypothetical protein